MKYFSILFFIISASYSLATAPCEDAFQLKQNPFFVGVKEAKQLLKLGKMLRSKRVNPYATHIPMFSKQVPAHYEHFKKSLEQKRQRKNVNSNNKQLEKIYKKKLSILNFLYQEALSKIEQKKLSYSYWVHWNIRLTKVIAINSSEELDKIKKESYLNIDAIENRTKAYLKEVEKKYKGKPQIQKSKTAILKRLRKELLTQIKDDWDNSDWSYHKYLCNIVLHQISWKWGDIEKIRGVHSKSGVYPQVHATDFSTKLHKSIESFPTLIALPTTKNLGIVALNQFTDGIVPLGLGFDGAMADGQPLDHFDFFSHDLNHHHTGEFGYPTQMSSKWKDKKINKEEFFDAFLKVTSDYPIDEYKKVHLAYFIQEHESAIVVKKVNKIHEQLKKYLNSTSILPRFKNKNDLGIYLEMKNPSKKDILDYIADINLTYKKTLDQIIEIAQENQK